MNSTQNEQTYFKQYKNATILPWALIPEKGFSWQPDFILFHSLPREEQQQQSKEGQNSNPPLI